MRKSITTLLSAGLLAVALLAADSPTPAAAQDAACKWQLRFPATIVQGNGHRVYLSYSDGVYKAKSYDRDNDLQTVSSEVAFTSVTPCLVKFIITWVNHTAGIYTGSIDSDGFVTGVSRDRFNPKSKTSWNMVRRARCG